MAKNKHYGVNLKGELTTFQTIRSDADCVIAKFNGEIKYNGSLLPYIVENPVREERTLITIFTDEIPSVLYRKNMRCVHIMKMKNDDKEYYATTFASHYVRKEEDIVLLLSNCMIEINNKDREFNVTKNKGQYNREKKILVPFRPNKVMTYSLYDPEVITKEQAENTPHTIEVLPVESIVDLIGKKVLGVTLIQPSDTLIRRAKGAFINVNKIDADGKIEIIQTIRPNKNIKNNNNIHHSKKENPKKKYVGKK